MSENDREPTEGAEPAPPSSPASMALTVDHSAAEPLASLDDLDRETLRPLLLERRRFAKISQWSLLLPCFAFIGWNLGTLAGILPSGFSWIHIALTSVYAGSIVPVLLANSRHWNQQCAELGLSRKQAKALSRHLPRTLGGRSPRELWGATSEERVEWEIDGLLGQKELEGPRS